MILRLLKIRPDEAASALRLVGLMVLAWAGAAIGANGVESLFFARLGPRYLPFMFIALGLVTFPVTLAFGALLTRVDRRRVLAMHPLALALVVGLLRLLVMIPARWVYPVLWLGMMVVWTLLLLNVWGLAGIVNDTRQAKRLYPLYGAGAILGGAVGGLATSPLAATIGAENLLLVWAASLAGVAAIARSVSAIRRSRRHPLLPRRRHARSGLLADVRHGADVVWRSSLLRRMSVAAVLFALLYFTLSLPFAATVTDRYPDADRLAAFLGVFWGVTNLAALGVSLLVANRLFAKVGVATMLAAFALIYVVGFSVLTVEASFARLVVFRFAQLVWMSGVWASAWQALWGVVPAEHRDQARAFVEGGPMQAGTVLAGVLLLLAQRALPPRGLFAAGAGVAVLATAAGWAVRRAYRHAVVEALRAGWPDVLVAEDAPFGGRTVDAAAIAALGEAVEDVDPVVRRAAMELLAELPAERSRAWCVRGLEDPDPAVRAAARMSPPPVARLRPLLADDDALVRVRSAAALASGPDRAAALATIEAVSSSDVPEHRAMAVATFGEVRHVAGVVGALRDPDRLVRRHAATAAGHVGVAAVQPLLDALEDEDAGVRAAAARALAARGPDVTPRLIDALDTPARAEGALVALRHLPTPPRERIAAHAAAEVERALRYHSLWQRLPADDGPVRLLTDSVRRAALDHAAAVLRAEAVLGDAVEIDLALEGLGSRDRAQRSNAIELLDAVRARPRIGAVADIWDPAPARAVDGAPAAVAELLVDADPWIRAAAAFAATRTPLERDLLARVARDDADALVRETAAAVLEKGDPNVETPTTVTVMERVLSLRQVPLFRELSPADLRRIAEATTEHVFPDGTLIAARGDVGDAMHVVQSGEVRVLAEERDGRLVEVARRGPGYIVGEMAVLTDEPRMASLVAQGHVRTLSLDRHRFQRILRDRPDAALAVVRELCARLREVHAQPPTEVEG